MIIQKQPIFRNPQGVPGSNPRAFLRIVAAGLLIASFSQMESNAQDAESQPVIQDAYDGTAIEQFTPHRSQPQRGPRKISLYPKVIRYAHHLLAKYDLNRDGVLQKEEWMSMHGHPELIATYDEEVITLERLTNWIADYAQKRRNGAPTERNSIVERSNLVKSSSAGEDEDSNGAPTAVDSIRLPSNASSSETSSSDGGQDSELQTAVISDGLQSPTNERRRDQKYYVPTKRLPAGLPDWFFARDKDGDGQLTASEYSATGLSSELAEFERLDANGDGVVTAKECVSKRPDKPAAAKTTAEVLPEQSSEKQSRGRRKPRVAQ